MIESMKESIHLMLLNTAVAGAHGITIYDKTRYIIVQVLSLCMCDCVFQSGPWIWTSKVLV